jgi:peptidoglycan-N-acetylglucosamine deacetylase
MCRADRGRIVERSEDDAVAAPAKLIGAIMMSAGIAFAATSAASAQSGPAAAPPDESAACWTPQQLAATASERLVRKMVPAAFIDPPRREPADFSPVVPTQFGVIRRVTLPPGKKLVALTFDLCEEPNEIAGYQGNIVDFLRANNVKATFFAGGKWMLSHDQRAQQLMSDPLFQIGNHTWEHRDLRILHGQKLTDEIRNAQLAYEDVRSRLDKRQCVRPDRPGPVSLGTPTRLSLLRLPFGACNPDALREVYRLGLTPIQWDVSSGDAPPGQSQKEMLKDVVGGVRPGSIVLFHANGRGLGTEEALPVIVKALRAKGYAFATIGELMQAGVPEITPTCYDHKVGDTDHYDALALRLEAAYSRARRQMPATAPLSDKPASPDAPSASEPPAPATTSALNDAAAANEVRPDPAIRVPLPRPRPLKRAKPALSQTGAAQSASRTGPSIAR